MEDVRKLLDNKWVVLLFRDGLGQYSALAVPDDESIDAALAAWVDHEPGEDVSLAETIFDGPHRMCGCGRSVAAALEAVTEKVLFRRLPEVDRASQQGERSDATP